MPESELTIETKCKPIWIRQYPISEEYKSAVDLKVQEWIDAGVVVPAPPNCPWNLPLIAARKPGKDGIPDGVRVCIDARRLNAEILVTPNNNLPTIREIQNSLGGFEWLSVIDLADSYHQFAIRPEDQQKLAFTWGKHGHLMFTGVPFGVKTMTDHMQRLMEKLLGPCGKKPFLDDVATASKSTSEHIQDVLQVLIALTYTAGLRLRLKKCKFFVKKARVLGSLITQQGIRMDPLKVRVIQEWPRPTDAKAMQRFLGAANFHREFSHEYAQIAAPLEDVRNAKGMIDWTPERCQAFVKIKELFASGISLQNVDWNKPIYLTTDASLLEIDAWIGQSNIKGDIVPVICVSKKLSLTQQRWSATKRELYGLI